MKQTRDMLINRMQRAAGVPIRLPGLGLALA